MLDPILVVDVFPTFKLSSEMVHHYVPVLKKFSPVFSSHLATEFIAGRPRLYGDDNVSIGFQRPAPHIWNK